MPMPMSMQAGPYGLGDLLRDQVSGETEETRKKRMAQLSSAGRQLFAGLGSGLDNVASPLALGGLR